MSGSGEQGRENKAGFTSGADAAVRTRTALDAEEGIFGQWAGSPAFRHGAAFKKPERSGAVGMRGIDQSDQHIGIKELDHDFPEAMAMTRASSSSY